MSHGHNGGLFFFKVIAARRQLHQLRSNTGNVLGVQCNGGYNDCIENGRFETNNETYAGASDAGERFAIGRTLDNCGKHQSSLSVGMSPGQHRLCFSGSCDPWFFAGDIRLKK